MKAKKRTKKRDARVELQSCCFAYLNLLLFDVPVSVVVAVS